MSINSIKANVAQNDKIKRIMNRKILLGVGAIIVAVAFIAITSFIPFIITGEKLRSEKFWTDEMIIVAITIFAMMSALFIGQASNAQNPGSEIAKAKKEFVESVKTIVNVNFFAQWVKKVLQPRDIQFIKERELRRIGIDDYTILQLTDAEIKALSENAQKYNGRYYSQISVDQMEFILELKDGVKKIHLVEPNYYLTVSTIDVDKTISEKSGREQLKKTVKLVFSVASKLLITLIPAMIFAALARDLTATKDVAQALATFFSRMMALISSAFMGYLVGCQTNDIDADYIKLRVDVHKQYLQDNGFAPKTEQELAKEQFVERVKQENAEYGKSLGFNSEEDNKPNNPIVLVEENKQ